MQPLYVAAPYRADTPEEVTENVRRACVLGHFAFLKGFAPIVMHPAIHAGVYGNDAIPAERAQGVAVDHVFLTMIHVANGRMWVILRDDGSHSEGVMAEVAFLTGEAPVVIPDEVGTCACTYAEASDPAYRCFSATWAEWCVLFTTEGHAWLTASDACA